MSEPKCRWCSSSPLPVGRDTCGDECQHMEEFVRHTSTLRIRAKEWFFSLFRPYVNDGWSPNEDYICGHCGEPVLRRYLFCSVACTEDYEAGRLQAWATAASPSQKRMREAFMKSQSDKVGQPDR